jgi:membrane associated rhomboid family serine protease/Flp pilus assembly protein TadD
MLRARVTLGFTVVAMVVAIAMYATGVAPWMASAQEVLRWGASFGGYTVGKHQWWRLLTMSFVHVGVWHLVMNFIALWTVGPTLERHLGGLRYGLLYLLCALTASLASLAWHPLQASCGSSGAIFGVFAATAVIGFLQPDVRAGWSPRAWRAARNTPVALLLVAALPVDNAGHLGGVLGGALLGLCVVRQVGRVQVLAITAAMVAVLALVGVRRYEAHPTVRAHRLVDESYRAIIAGDGAAAQRHAEAAAVLQPGDAGVQLQLGYASWSAGDVESAWSAFVRARQLKGGEPSASAYLCGLALPKHEIDGSDACDRAFSGELSGVALLTARQGRSLVRLERQEWRRALEDADAALASGGNTPDIHYVRAWASHALGQKDQVAVALAGLRALPPSARREARLLALLVRLFRFEEVLDEAPVAARAGVDAAWIKRARGWALYHSGHRQEGLAELDGATDADALATHAGMLRREKRAAAAVAEATRALVLAPELSQGFSVRCWALVDLGQPVRALPDCKRGWELDQRNAEDDLGMVYFLEGNPAEALAHWESVLRLYPGDALRLEPYLGRARRLARR